MAEAEITPTTEALAEAETALGEAEVALARASTALDRADGFKQWWYRCNCLYHGSHKLAKAIRERPA